MMINKTPWPDEPFTRADLTGIDNPDAAIKRGIRGGAIRSVLRGVFVRVDVPDTMEMRARAVAKVVKPHHVVTDRTAAWLHGVDVHLYAERTVLPSVETCALRGHAPTTITGVNGRTRDLLPVDVMSIGGVLVTTPLRTAMDLGCCLRRREAFAALNVLVARFGLATSDLKAALRRYRRRRGVVQLRQLIDLVDPRLESAREAWVLISIHDAGLPLPQPQYWVVVDGVPRYRLDFAYPHLRVCIEYDGSEFHEQTQEQIDADERRRAWLRANGWTVIVVRRGDFGRVALERWTAELRSALAPAYTNRRWKW